VFIRKAALRPVPAHARVDEHAIEALEAELDHEGDGLQQVLDTGFREMENRQPLLAGWLSDQVADGDDELSQSVGYFLVVSVYLAFREAFPRRLVEVDEGALRMALDTLTADEELRAEDPREVLDSDDVVALGQPRVVDFIQHHLEEALKQAGNDVDLGQLDRIYRALLIEVIALSHAVESAQTELTS
jgi:hypothetical protein